MNASGLGQLPVTVGPYTLVEKLGQGGMGEVFLARERLDGGDIRFQVVKTVRNDRDNAVARGRFFDEARVVVQLSHPNICQVRAVGELDARPFLAMDHVRGIDLKRLHRALTARGAGLELAASAEICLRVLDALAFAHDKVDDSGRPLNIVHRDVSPNNILVGFDGKVSLIDFGLALSDDKIQKTAHGVVLGKPRYMSPEHAMGMRLDRRTDLFAVGVVLYELVTGRRFYGARQAKEIIPLLATGQHDVDYDGVPEAIAKVVETAITRDPGRRFQTATQFRQSLEAAFTSLNVAPSRDALRIELDLLFSSARMTMERKLENLLDHASPVVDLTDAFQVTAAFRSLSGGGESLDLSVETTSVVRPEPRQRGRGALVLLMALMLVVGAAALAWILKDRFIAPPDVAVVAAIPTTTPPVPDPVTKIAEPTPEPVPVPEPVVEPPEPEPVKVAPKTPTKRRPRVKKRVLPPLPALVGTAWLDKIRYLQANCQVRVSCAKSINILGYTTTKDQGAYEEKIAQCLARCRRKG